MNKTLALSAIVSSTILLLPYLFYALLFRGGAGFVWVLICLCAFFAMVRKFRTDGLSRMLLVSLLSSLAIALASLPIKSIGLFISLFAGGFLVLGLFSYGLAGLSRS